MSDDEITEVEIRREGGMDVWLSPLALMGSIVIVGPVLVVVLQRVPAEVIHEHQLELGVLLTVCVGLVLLMSFGAAKAIVNRGRRLLRIGRKSVDLFDHKGKRHYAGSAREEVRVEPKNYVINAQSGTFVSPVLWVTFPGQGRLELSVDERGLRWTMDTDECDEEAEYLIRRDEWRRLVDAFDLGSRLEGDR